MVSKTDTLPRALRLWWCQTGNIACCDPSSFEGCFSDVLCPQSTILGAERWYLDRPFFNSAKPTLAYVQSYMLLDYSPHYHGAAVLAAATAGSSLSLTYVMRWLPPALASRRITTMPCQACVGRAGRGAFRCLPRLDHDQVLQRAGGNSPCCSTEGETKIHLPSHSSLTSCPPHPQTGVDTHTFQSSSLDTLQGEGFKRELQTSART